MKRNLQALSDTSFDLLIIGGGIIGLTAALEAALRGLSVALIEKEDFGSATSANSLKLIHGGLRYLQHADFRRMRQSIRERLAFMRMAPHLVHPLPFLLPTYGHATKSKEAMKIAFLLYNMVAFDRNRTGDPEKRIPGGQTISATECLDLFPGFKKEGLTGGAVFFDGQMYNSERLTLSFALAADRAGATLANYTRAIGFIQNGDRIAGVKVRDEIDGQDFEIEARMVLNAAGPWADSLLNLLEGSSTKSGYLLAKAVNIVSPRLLTKQCAVGIESRDEQSDSLVKRGGRMFFITPWRKASLIGTAYTTYRDDPDDLSLHEDEIVDIIKGINHAWPEAELKREEITFFHRGLVPITAPTGPGGANLAKSDKLIDHKAEDGIDGIVSIIGVKYTTARDMAEKALDMIFEKLGLKGYPSTSADIRLPGGAIDNFNDFLKEAIRQPPMGLDPAIMTHLVYNYGSDYLVLLHYGNENQDWARTVPGSQEVLKAEVLHAVNQEMAVKLSDSVLRRTELGAMGHPGAECIKACAAIMAGQLGWDDTKVNREIEETERAFRLMGQ